MIETRPVRFHERAGLAASSKAPMDQLQCEGRFNMLLALEYALGQAVTDTSEFQALCAAIGADLTVEGARRLLAYLDAMLDENERINLTAVREREAAVMFHALDSAALACCGPGEAPTRALDLGTGNGFPGVAIACLYPDATVVLMDRRLKKLHAIMRALGAAGFDTDQFEIAHMDAVVAKSEGYSAQFDLITTRAVGPPEAVGKLAKPLLAPAGQFVAWLSDESEAPEKLKCGLRLSEAAEYLLPAPADRNRRIASYDLNPKR